jgi:hypothetical protein
VLIVSGKRICSNVTVNNSPKFLSRLVLSLIREHRVRTDILRLVVIVKLKPNLEERLDREGYSFTFSNVRRSYTTHITCLSRCHLINIMC